MKPKKPIKGKKSYGRRNILNKQHKINKTKTQSEPLNKVQKNAKFVQRVRKMQEEHRKQKRIEDKYRAEASASMLNTYMHRDELIHEMLTEVPKDDAYDTLLQALNQGQSKRMPNQVHTDTESEAEQEQTDVEHDNVSNIQSESEAEQLDALYSSDEEKLTENTTNSKADDDFIDNTHISDEDDETSDVEVDAEKQLNSSDNFMQHVDYELTPEHLENLLATPVERHKHNYMWPALGKIDIEVPKRHKQEQTAYALPTQTAFKQSELKENGLKASLAANLTSRLSNMQLELFSIVNSYVDVYYPKRTFEQSIELREVYCLHALNHLKKTRARVMQHNAKLLAASKQAEKRKKKSKKLKQKTELESGIVPDNYRDQGFVRPKVLILLPTRDAVYHVVNTLASFYFGANVLQCDNHKGKLINYERFVESYTGNTLHFPKVKPKPEDYEQIFAGNTDDNFRLGLTLTKKTLKLFTDFYASDILIASPLGLRTIIGAAGSEQRDYDFLNSIELLIIDQADMLLAQNWENVLHVMEHLHLQPQTLERTTDFQRVRSWYINGWARFYRQTLLFATHQLPEFKALINNKCANYAGKVSVSYELNDIRNVVLNVAQVFERFHTPSLLEMDDKRFEFFTTQILPRYKQTSYAHCMIYVPSYFDYVRLRNYFRQEHLSFVQICEYTKPAKIARARDIFYHSGAHFMLYSERAHYFRRTRIKGIRHLIMYAPPAFPHFYSELINLMQNTHQNARDGLQDHMSITVLYNQLDGLQLSNILGKDNTARLLISNNSVHAFTAE